MASEILTEIFPQKESSYSLRNSTTLQGRSIKTVTYGSETISSLRPKLWEILPTGLKRIVSPTQFKKKFVNGSQRIAHVVYVNHIYKTLDFCKIPVRTYIVV